MANQFSTIQQEITASNDWNGTEPTTTPVIADGVKAYPAHTAGGLFEFGFSESFILWQVDRIAVDFNGVSSKSIVIRKSGAPDITVWESSLSAESKLLWTDPILLQADESLVLLSTSASNAMYARVTARPVTAREARF